MKNKSSKQTYKSDYSKMNLPRSRTQQFGRIIRDNLVLFIKLGLILLLLTLPFIFALAMKNITFTNITQNTSLSDTEKANNYIVISVIFAGIYIPCIMFLFVGLCGILKILRRLIWDEPLFFKEDFFLGIKESFKPFLLFGFLVGLISFLCIFTYQITSGYMKYVSYVLIGISFAIVVPIILVAAYISSIYNSKLSVAFTVSLKLFIRRGIFTILILLILYCSYFLILLPIPLIVFVGILFVLVIFLFPIWMLLSYINCIKNLDDYINVYHYPEQAYLGLYINQNKTEEKKD